MIFHQQQKWLELQQHNMKIEIKGENQKKIEIEMKDLNLDERGDFNDLYSGATFGEYKWSAFAKSCLIATKLTDDQLNEYTDLDIINISKECYVVVNKKKLKK